MCKPFVCAIDIIERVGEGLGREGKFRKAMRKPPPPSTVHPNFQNFVFQRFGRRFVANIFSPCAIFFKAAMKILFGSCFVRSSAACACTPRPAHSIHLVYAARLPTKQIIHFGGHFKIRYRDLTETFHTGIRILWHDLVGSLIT